MIPAAVGILRRADGRVLLQRRPAGKVFAGHWEFPGGKIHAGESASAALARELREEVGVEAADARLWLRRTHSYPHGEIDLRFFRVCEWRGKPEPREGQELRWAGPREVGGNSPSPLLPANAPVWRRLALPDLVGVSAAEVLGAEKFLRGCARALESGLGMIQFRDKNLKASERLELGGRVAEMARTAGALFVVNDDEVLARKLEADGLHLSSRRLAELASTESAASTESTGSGESEESGELAGSGGAKTRRRFEKTRRDFKLLGASCHGRGDLLLAEKLGLDYAILSPVKRTLTHADASPLGWAGFAELSREFEIPLYGLGGLGRSDLPDAFAAGAQGAAMMRAAWETENP